MHYVIIGNGVAGITAAFTIREKDKAARISVIGGESDYFISRTALMYAFMDRLSVRDLEPFERKTYDARRIDRIRGWVTGLDAEAHTIQLQDGLRIAYDRLLLATGSSATDPSWPGVDSVESGVVSFVSLQDLQACERIAPSTRRAVVAGGGLIGVELVECLVHHGIEVDFLVREAWYWPMALASEEGDIIAAHLRRHGVRLHLDEEIAEVSTGADGRVSGVRTRRGASLPCQMLGVCIGVRPAIDWLRSVKTPPALNRGIRIANDFQTSLPDIWAAGDCAELPGGLVEQTWYSAKRQGKHAAEAVLGGAANYEPPLFYNSAKFFDIEFTTVGAAAAEGFFHRVPGKEISLRIMHAAGAVTGFNTLGSRWNHVWFEKWIRERRSLDYVLANLRAAQFDGEFGRIPFDGLVAS